MKRLQETVAVVTGASRGAGRAIAAVLGEAGATVYVTGRSTRASGNPEGIAGTIEETAEEVSRRGGRGIAVRCDHTSYSDVEALFAQVRQAHGKLDLLVNNAWGGYEHHDGEGFMAPFWQQPFDKRWDGMFTAGVRAHLCASHLAVPLMLPHKRGLLIGTIAWDRGKYLGNVFYDVAKSAIVRAMFCMAKELLPHGISAVTLAPGFMRTERVLAAHAQKPFDLSQTESPEYVGRAVAALASDPEVLRKSGETLRVGDLAREYGFTDIDGRQVPPFEIPDIVPGSAP